MWCGACDANTNININTKTQQHMNAKLGWTLAALAVALGYSFWGWRGVALAASGMVFWMLMQFTRSLRVMRSAAQAPIGTVQNAVMFNARLSPGMRLMNILVLTRSLGEKISDAPETYRWHDGGGDSVQVVLHNGRCTAWQLVRAAGLEAGPVDVPVAETSP